MTHYLAIQVARRLRLYSLAMKKLITVSFNILIHFHNNYLKFNYFNVMSFIYNVLNGLTVSNCHICFLVHMTYMTLVSHSFERLATKMTEF